MAKLQRGHRAIAPEPTVTDVRPLTRDDLSHLTVKREATVVQTLRDNHHRMARAVAGGLSNSDVAATCGVSIARVASLKLDPSFAELVAHYRSILTTEWAQADTVIELMRGNALKAAAMLSDKIEEAAEKGEYLPTGDLVKIQELGFDRVGYGKVNKNVNINVDFAAKLEEARNRSARASSLRTIEGTTTSLPVPGAVPSSGAEHQPVAPQRLVSPAPPPPKLRRL